MGELRSIELKSINKGPENTNLLPCLYNSCWALVTFVERVIISSCTIIPKGIILPIISVNPTITPNDPKNMRTVAMGPSLENLEV